MTIGFRNGTALRTYPRLNIVTGDRRNTTESDIVEAPVASGHEIWEGMAISQNSSGEWVRGVPVDGSAEAYIALKDSFSSSAAGGVLPAISIASGVIIETFFYVKTETYTVGEYVKALAVGTTDPAGFFTTEDDDVTGGAAAGVIVGRVREIGGDISAIYDECAPANAKRIRIALGGKDSIAS